jgi:hypothetical protein
MAHACRVLLLFLLASVSSQGAITVTWNTQPSPEPSTRPGVAAVQPAQVVAVNGARVVVRLSDGTTRTYLATPAQARELRELIGTIIHFRVR